MEEAIRQNVFCISITNEPNSPLAVSADQAIILKAGKEISVPASKTYTAQLVMLALISAFWSGDPILVENLNHLGDQAEEVLGQHDAVKSVAKRFGMQEHLAVAGAGLITVPHLKLLLKSKNFLTW